MKRFILVLGFMLLLLGCIGGESPPQNNTNTTPPPAQPKIPVLTIVSPDEGQVFSTDTDYGSIDIFLSTSNLIVKPEGTTTNAFGEGHFAISVDEGDQVHIFTKSYTLEGITPGSHTLRVEVVNNDHSSYSPSIVKMINFYMEKANTEYIPQHYTVAIRDFSYEPATLTVNVNDTVTWINEGAYPRSATYTGIFDTQMLAPGQNATITMSTPGTFEYYALSYRAMKGTIIVNPSQ